MAFPYLPSIYWYIPGVTLFMSPSQDISLKVCNSKTGCFFLQICAALWQKWIPKSLLKVKGVCWIPCGPQMFLLLPLCKDNLLQPSSRTQSKGKRHMLLFFFSWNVMKRPKVQWRKWTNTAKWKNSIHRLWADKREEWEAHADGCLLRESRGGQYHTLHRKMRGKDGWSSCWLF